MSTVTNNMGLTKWDGLNDKFSHAQLAANWQAVDDHDHTPTKGKQIPAGGIAPLAVDSGNLKDGVFTEEKIADDAVTADKLADGAVSNAAIAAGAGIPDSKLASPNNAVWRNVHHWSSRGFAVTNGSVVLLNYGGFAGDAADDTDTHNVFYLDDADYASTLTPYFRLRVQLFTNATAPTSTFTVGLNPVASVAGGANNQSATLGAAVGSSTVNFVAPSASTRFQNVSSAFALPADGYYTAAMTVSVATMAANSLATVNAQLQVRHV